MGTVIFLLLLWALIGAGLGFVLSRIESKVNNQPPRTLNCILWVILTGIIGILVVGVRSSLTYAGGIRKDVQASGDAARAAQTAAQRDVL